MSWGRGWEVGVNKARWQNERTLQIAAEILADEHGSRHKPGERTDLCPKCAAGSHTDTETSSNDPLPGTAVSGGMGHTSPPTGEEVQDG